MTRTNNYLTTTLAAIAMLSAAPALAGNHGHSHNGGGSKHSFSKSSNNSFSNKSSMSSNARRSQNYQLTTKQPLKLSNNTKSPSGGNLTKNMTSQLGKTNVHPSQKVNSFKQPFNQHNNHKLTNATQLNKDFTKNLYNVNGKKSSMSKHFNGNWNGNWNGQQKSFCFPNYCSPKHPWCNSWTNNNWCNPWYGNGCYFPSWCGGYYPYYGGFTRTRTIVQPVVTQTTTAAIEQPAPAVQPVAQAIDLELLEVRQIDRGDIAKDQGPAYAITLRNTTGEAVAQPFTVALAASIGRTPAADTVFASSVVEGLDAGQPATVEVRLPVEALKIGVNADGQPVPFGWLTAVADPQMEVEQADRENDYTTINRSDIVMVALQR